MRGIASRLPVSLPSIPYSRILLSASREISSVLSLGKKAMPSSSRFGSPDGQNRSVLMPVISPLTVSVCMWKMKNPLCGALSETTA